MLANIINKIIDNRVFKSSFVKDVFAITSGTSLAQIIPLAISPILTRIYSPDEFGVFAIYLSLVSILTVIATARYELAVMLPDNDTEASNIVCLAIFLSSLVSVIILAVVTVFDDSIGSLIKGSASSGINYIVPIGVLLCGIYQAINYWVSRKKQYSLLARNKVTQSLIIALATIAIGIFGSFHCGLVAGTVIGQFVSILLIYINITRQAGFKITNNFNKLIEIAKKYKHFPMFSLPGSVADILALQAPLFMLNKYYSSVDVGSFGLITRVLAAPSALIGYSISQVYYRKITTLVIENNNAEKFVTKTAVKLFMLTLLPLLFFVLFAPKLFVLIFGDNWRDAGNYAQVVAVAYAFKFVVSPLSLALPATGYLNFAAIWQFMCLFTTYTTLFIGSQFTIKTFFLIYTVHEIVMYSLYFAIIVYALKKHSRKSAKLC